jgi:hypothetical protein
MTETTSDVQRDIAETRARMSETIAELDAQISSRVAVVKERLDVSRVIQDHPWAALTVAIGVGVLLAGTGADAKAARATVRAAKGAPGATANLARRGLGAATGLVRRDGNDGGDADVAAEDAVDTQPVEPGLADRLKDGISRALGVDELIGQMRDAAAEFARPASYVGQNVPRNTGQQM